jgi:hypothetical protein
MLMKTQEMFDKPYLYKAKLETDTFVLIMQYLPLKRIQFPTFLLLLRSANCDFFYLDHVQNNDNFCRNDLRKT